MFYNKWHKIYKKWRVCVCVLYLELFQYDRIPGLDLKESASGYIAEAVGAPGIHLQSGMSFL